MHGYAVFARGLRVCVLGLGLAGIPDWAAQGAEVNLTYTNRVERWITNFIEVRMPANRFVNEYRTNWVEQVHRKVIDVYATNTLTRTFTNNVTVNALQTNFVQAFRTNWQRLEVTRDVPIDLVRTNFVERYRTNWTVWTLTNWQTVVMLRTNWVTQQITNVVQVDASPAREGAADLTVPKETVEPRKAGPETTLAQAEAIPPDAVLLEAERTTRTAANDKVEVRLSVRGANGAAARFHVLHWRVERLDGAILVFGREQEFKRELPVGEYKVEFKGQQEENGSVLTARGKLSLTEREAHIQQKLLVTR